MAKAKRDLLEVLRLELEFLKNGGYRRAPSWRSTLIFEGFSDLPALQRSGAASAVQGVRDDAVGPESWRGWLARRERAGTLPGLRQWYCRTSSLRWRLHTATSFHLQKLHCPQGVIAPTSTRSPTSYSVTPWPIS